MIRKNLLQLLFSGACLWRWNDKLRPVELSEIEKQAHKMILACVLWNESTAGMGADARAKLGLRIVEGGLFDYFYRLIITDIKPPVFYMIKENPEHYKKLTEHVLEKLEPVLSPLGPFWERMTEWHKWRESGEDLERRILSASHLFASRWEFNLIRRHNWFDEEMDAIGRSFDEQLATYADLPGMDKMLEPHNQLARFASLCGQLRFQIRWTQEPRLPATSVLGHMFMVAACVYFFSLSLQASEARAVNNFFSGLLHDFPELLTRDIISPVKASIPGLAGIIRDYEKSELERRALGPLRQAGMDSLVDLITYYLGLDVGSEFQECRRKDGKTLKIEGFEAMAQYDSNENDPRDGQLLKVCDLLAAFLEAHNSIANGVSSRHLVEARGRLKRKLSEKQPEILRLGALLADYD